MLLKQLFILWLLLTFFCSRAHGQHIIVGFSDVPNVNGVYSCKGEYNGHPMYAKDGYIIRYRGCYSKWEFVIAGKMHFKNFADSDDCPLDGWQLACAGKTLTTKVPIFKSAVPEAPLSLSPPICVVKPAIIHTSLFGVLIQNIKMINPTVYPFNSFYKLGEDLQREEIDVAKHRIHVNP